MRMITCLLLGIVAAITTPSAFADDVSNLRLIPFPKQISPAPGSFSLNRPLTVQLPAASEPLLDLLQSELRLANLPIPQSQPLPNNSHALRLTTTPADPLPAAQFRSDATSEDYLLQITPESIVIQAPERPGLLHGLQTLRQLIRANRTPDGIPCLTLRDWPSLRWRCFQDDLTRGPSSTLDTLKREASLGSYFHLNLFTYYMEYQYAFKKHPLIGPKDGSLQPDDLQTLIDYAKPLGIDVLGNQQSFGHFGAILRHEKYASLRENSDVITPAKEETYQLLDDLYSEVCPLLPFEMFNVCCDETDGLGTGPSKALSQKIGVGGVYVRHLRRIHDLLQSKYHKRMMMWGDIILQHPDHLKDIPKDTVMLTWGYDARASFEDQILPFAKSGYQFFICPGVSNWSRILPDFAIATTNIRNFVRDGAKHGALGMLNTSWEDDGEALKGYIWHAHAFAAECAWNASTTDPADFNRRLGAVLFGEKGNHFGQAIELLAKTHSLPGMKGMNNSRFWDFDFILAQDPAAIQSSANQLLALVRPAIEHLQACQRDATINADLLDAFLFGARRMELLAQRMLDGLEATQAYAQARQSPKPQALTLLDRTESLIRRTRDAHDALRRQFSTLWLKESKPYALDWTIKRYDAAIARYDEILKRLTIARKVFESGTPLPPLKDIGFISSK